MNKQKIDTKNIKNSGEYTLRAVISYLDENGKKKNIKKYDIYYLYIMLFTDCKNWGNTVRARFGITVNGVFPTNIK